MRGSSFFDGIHQAEITSRGHATATPTFYYDAGLMEAVFPARLGVLRALLPDPRFVPLRLAPGVGAVVLDCFEYRDSDLGPYNELGIGIMLATPGTRPNLPGRQLAAILHRRQGHAFIAHLPVTTEIALVLGVDFFAFPKFLADIEFREDAGGRRCRLSEDGEHILTVTGRRIETPGRRVWQSFAHLWMDAQPQRAEVRMNQLAHGTCRRPGAARVELGDRHPIARELDRMLLGRSSLSYDLVPRQEQVLFGPDHLTAPLVRRLLAGSAAPEPAGVSGA
jgi:hypothetical protein